MAEDSRFKITLKIGRLSFNPEVERSDEEIYRKAVVAINSKIEKFRKKSSKLTDEQVLSLVALELAVQMLNRDADCNELVAEMNKLDDLLSSAE